MIYRHIRFNGLFLLFTFARALLSNASLAACNLHEMLLINERACARFKAAGAKLNKTYKKLMLELDFGTKPLLRSSQRKWIDWRDEKCEQVQEDSGCQNSLCNGVAHDICIIDLANQRTQELKEHFLNTEDA